jgi:hypothetical protein
MVIYQRVDILVGHPIWINPDQRQAFQGKQAKLMVNELTDYCQTEIKDLMQP